MKIDRAEYLALCQSRWHGVHLGDARGNFADFEEIHDQLVEALRAFKRDPWQKDIADRCLNPDGTLTAFLWKLQSAITPDRASLWPLLDFEEHFQQVFLRRGLIFYCQLALREIETVELETEPSLFHLSQPESHP